MAPEPNQSPGLNFKKRTRFYGSESIFVFYIQRSERNISFSSLFTMPGFKMVLFNFNKHINVTVYVPAVDVSDGLIMGFFQL